MTAAVASDPLDQRLVEAGLRLLREEGIEGLTLRRIARAAGVSHGAPLRHFRGRADLLAEVAARGFAMLSDAIDASALPRDASPLDRLAAAGRAYVRTAVAQPALFALMFRPDQLDYDNPSLATTASAAFDKLLDRVREAQGAGWQPDRDTRLLAGCVWSAVHGFATLWAQGALGGPVSGASFEDALSTTLELALGSRQGATT